MKLEIELTKDEAKLLMNGLVNCVALKLLEGPQSEVDRVVAFKEKIRLLIIDAMKKE